MFKTSTEQIVQEFATTNENWKANTNLSDSTKIRLLSVAEEIPERGFVGRILNRKTAFIHGTTFTELEENKNTSECEPEYVETIAGELDTSRTMKLEGSVKAEMVEVFKTSFSGSYTVTAENDFGKLYKKIMRQQELVKFFDNQ
ncbi:hypothetical protein EB796_012292 [Bugula neritina]|uniref:Uncharacterized protein n=1 Tax=Bugula neritina TaxID=10212 RepID=A0A7J7JU11_BUGNE|nr:hypothetical protein EB796_012292 [Bugula neritina]